MNELNYNHGDCCCDSGKTLVKEPVHDKICENACDLLKTLDRIECEVLNIHGILFGSDEDVEGKNPEPTCLRENIDMALDKARFIEKSLDAIIARL